MRADYPFWWIGTLVLLPAIALADCAAPARCISPQTAATCRAAIVDLKRCRSQPRPAPLPRRCTPVTVVVNRDVPRDVVVERTDWRATAIGVVVGFVGGAVAAWRWLR